MSPQCRQVTLAVMLAFVIGTANAGAYDDMLVAIKNDDTAKVLALLERGMDANTADQNGTTLVMYAARSGNVKLLEQLLSHHANILKNNNYGDTAISLSALEGHLDCVLLLAKSGADLNPSNTWTPLNYAAFNGHLEVATYLIEHGAIIDAPAPNGMTPLMLAARNGHLAVVQMLLDKHANASLKTPDGKAAEDIANNANQTQIASLLKSAAAHIK